MYLLIYTYECNKSISSRPNSFLLGVKSAVFNPFHAADPHSPGHQTTIELHVGPDFRTQPTEIVTQLDPLISPASWIRPDLWTIHDG